MLAGSRDQQGAVLIMGLVILLLLTLLGTSSMQVTSLQLIMAKNAADAALAFQAAESALRDAEAHIEASINDLTAFDGVNGETRGYYHENAPSETPNWMSASWGGSGTRSAETSLTGVAAQPEYLIEYLRLVLPAPESTGIWIFRITALGTGGTSRARAMLQTTYGKAVSPGDEDESLTMNSGRLSWRQITDT